MSRAPGHRTQAVPRLRTIQVVHRGRGRVNRVKDRDKDKATMLTPVHRRPERIRERVVKVRRLRRGDKACK